MHFSRNILSPGRTLRLFFTVVLFLITSEAPAQIFKLPHADTTRGNFFGVAVSIDGNRALVGASAEDVCGVNSGAAYIFEQNPENKTWKEVARLSPDDCTAGDFFGRAVSLSGNRALIAAAETFFYSEASNAAYVFELDSITGDWNQVARLTAEKKYEEGVFATSVSLDGDRALITTSGDPSGTRYSGAAYVFERKPDGTWTQVARLTSNDNLERGVFGGSGDLDGDRIVVAASTYYRYKPGSVYIFERDPAKNVWRQTDRIEDVNDFFISIDLDGDRLLVGESRGGWRRSGLATLYARGPSGKWHRIQTFEPSFPYEYGAFGTEVALDGNRVLITGYDEQLGFSFNIDRVVYLFECDKNGKWQQTRVIDVGEVAFGASIDQQNGLALIGHASEQEPGGSYIVHLP